MSKMTVWRGVNAGTTYLPVEGFRARRSGWTLTVIAYTTGMDRRPTGKWYFVGHTKGHKKNHNSLWTNTLYPDVGSAMTAAKAFADTESKQ